MTKVLASCALAACLAFAPPALAEIYRLDESAAESPLLQVDRELEPFSANVVAVQERDASALDPACRGDISREPTYVLDVVEPAPLLISAEAQNESPQFSDTTLVVLAPDGTYICDDDSGGDLNPQILIAQPQVGRYQVWVGTFAPFYLGFDARRVQAELRISQARTAGPGPRPADVETPAFPRWPPPRASARTEISRASFAGADDLGDIADSLMNALRAAGNSRASFYTAPGGFVIVARLERIRDDARPEANGRFVEPRPGQTLKPDDPLDFIEALFFAPEGHYRQVMFVVTDRPVGESNWTLTSDAAGDLLNQGSATLQADYRAMPYSPGQRVTALIYEFRKQGGAQAEVRVPGRWNASTHLARSGFTAGLSN